MAVDYNVDWGQAPERKSDADEFDTKQTSNICYVVMSS